MSGEPTSDALIGRWVCEFRSRALWKKFDESGRVDPLSCDLAGPFLRSPPGEHAPATPKGNTRGVQPQVQQPLLPPDCVELRSYLLVELMRKLSTGRLIGAPALSPGNVVLKPTTLEEAIDILDRLLEATNVSNYVSTEEVTRIRLAMKLQAVYVLCRAGEFEMARMVLERQWTAAKNLRETKLRDIIVSVINSGDSENPILTDEPYGALINEGRAFLRTLFTALPVPFLVKVAKNVCEKIKMASEANSLPESKDTGSSEKTAKTLGTIRLGTVAPVRPNLVSRWGGKTGKVVTKRKRGRPARILPPGGGRGSSGTSPRIKQEGGDVESNDDGDDDTLKAGMKRKSSEPLVPDVESSAKITSNGDSRSVNRRNLPAWTTVDEEMIFLGALRHGVGRWSEISKGFPGRTGVDVKDKWRTMVKQGKVELYEKIHGRLPISPSEDMIALKD